MSDVLDGTTGFRPVPWEYGNGDEESTFPLDPEAGRDDGDCCGAIWGPWGCTRDPGHDGSTHRAGTTTLIVAEWWS